MEEQCVTQLGFYSMHQQTSTQLGCVWNLSILVKLARDLTSSLGPLSWWFSKGNPWKFQGFPEGMVKASMNHLARFRWFRKEAPGPQVCFENPKFDVKLPKTE